MRFDNKNKIFYRENSDDKRMIKEVMEMETYKKLNLNSEDVVLDLGANIGTFAKKYNRKVKKIISIEPLKENIVLFKKNLKNINNVMLIEKAVSNYTKNNVIFYKSNNKKFAGGSLRPKRGYSKIKVNTLSLNSLINKYKPTKIKCDIEFEEFNLNWEVLKNNRVEILILEIHNDKKFRNKIIPLINKIKKVGFTTNFNKNEIKNNFPILLEFTKK